MRNHVLAGISPSARISVVFLLAVAAALPRAAHAQGFGQQPAVTAFVGANVIPMTGQGTVLRDQTIVVRDGRIADMGSRASIRVPAGARTIDASGKYLLPGLAEMHGHIPGAQAPQQFTDDVLFLYVANGITTVRGMLGAPNQFALRDKAIAGEIIAPTLYLAGPSFNGNSVQSVQQAVDRVRQQKAEGWDLLKIHPGVPRDAYDAMARTAREVGITFGGHVPEAVGLLHALEQRQLTFDHLDGYIEYLNGDKGIVDDAKIADVVRRSREAGAWVVPTQALWETLYGIHSVATLAALPELKYMPKNQVQQWIQIHTQRLASPEFNAQESHNVVTNRNRLLKALNDGGVPVLMGTDAPQQFSVPGFSLHRELQVMSQAGLSNYDILKSGTYNVGLYFKDKDAFGTIENGKRADLVLVDANPLDDIANLTRRSGVMVRGRWLSAEQIRAGLAAIEARNAN